MIQGTYYKEWSTVLGREMEFKVYGHAGVPVPALPARGGRGGKQQHGRKVPARIRIKQTSDRLFHRPPPPVFV